MKTTGELIERSVLIPPTGLEGDLVIPEKATAVIAFAHGSGSSRHSPRNQFVASALQKESLATLLIDLLDKEEEENRDKVFDIDLLAGQLESVTEPGRRANQALLRPGAFCARRRTDPGLDLPFSAPNFILPMLTTAAHQGRQRLTP